jgi:hypothetical protein
MLLWLGNHTTEWRPNAKGLAHMREEIAEESCNVQWSEGLALGYNTHPVVMHGGQSNRGVQET